MSHPPRARQYPSLEVFYCTRTKKPRFHPKRSLETFYERDPWPYNTVLKEIAAELNMSFEAVFEWFTKRRARAIGLTGVVDTIPNKGECPTLMSWRLYVAEFGDEKYRANVICALQHPLSPPEIRLEST